MLVVNISPGLKGADGVDLRDVDDRSQGFQSSTASFANLPRQSIDVKTKSRVHQVLKSLPQNILSCFPAAPWKPQPEARSS